MTLITITIDEQEITVYKNILYYEWLLLVVGYYEERKKEVNPVVLELHGLHFKIKNYFYDQLNFIYDQTSYFIIPLFQPSKASIALDIRNLLFHNYTGLWTTQYLHCAYTYTGYCSEIH